MKSIITTGDDLIIVAQEMLDLLGEDFKDKVSLSALKDTVIELMLRNYKFSPLIEKDQISRQFHIFVTPGLGHTGRIDYTAVLPSKHTLLSTDELTKDLFFSNKASNKSQINSPFKISIKNPTWNI